MSSDAKLARLPSRELLRQAMPYLVMVGGGAWWAGKTYGRVTAHHWSLWIALGSITLGAYLLGRRSGRTYGYAYATNPASVKQSVLDSLIDGIQRSAPNSSGSVSPGAVAE